jgi:hypothetical protein
MKSGSLLYRILFDDRGNPLAAGARAISSHDETYIYESSEASYDFAWDDSELSTLTPGITQDAE